MGSNEARHLYAYAVKVQESGPPLCTGAAASVLLMRVCAVIAWIKGGEVFPSLSTALRMTHRNRKLDDRHMPRREVMEWDVTGRLGNLPRCTVSCMAKDSNQT